MYLSVPGCVKTLPGMTAPGILRLVVTFRAKKCRNLSSAQHYDQIRFCFHTAWSFWVGAAVAADEPPVETCQEFLAETPPSPDPRHGPGFFFNDDGAASRCCRKIAVEQHCVSSSVRSAHGYILPFLRHRNSGRFGSSRLGGAVCPGI